MKRMLCIGAMQVGGAETFLMKLYRNIDRTRCQFDFCEPVDTLGYYDKEILELGGKIYHIPLKTRSFIGYREGLKELVAREGYRYVYRSASNAFAFMDLKYAKEAGAVKCVARSTNSREETRVGELFNWVGRRRFIKYVDLMLSPSSQCGKHTFGISNVQRGNVKILRNGIDFRQYQRDERFRKEYRQQNRLEDSFVVGHVGRFQKQKNHLFLIDIFSEIKKIKKNAVLLLVGERKGLYQQVVEKINALNLEKDVVFLGLRGDVNRLYSVMDVLLLPSLYEGLPNVIVEAQAAGLPCIISSSITKEVVDTDLVRQLPLAQTPKYWAEYSLNAANEICRSDIDLDSFKEKYDLKQIADWFQNAVFENN